MKYWFIWIVNLGQKPLLGCGEKQGKTWSKRFPPVINYFEKVGTPLDKKKKVNKKNEKEKKLLNKVFENYETNGVSGDSYLVE